MTQADSQTLGSVLLVDDDADARTMLAMLLAGYDIEVLEAGSGEEALELLSTRTPSLILLDFDMPGIDGVATLQKIRATHTEENLPVVMVSNRQDSEVIVGALDSGASDYVTKMSDPTVILARIRRHLIHRRLPVPDTRPFGGKLGAYELVEKVREGPAADLYLGRDGEKKVALKVLRPGFRVPDPTFEAFHHDLLADLLDVQREPVDFLVYQWIEGEPLDQFVDGKTLDRNNVLKLAIKLTEAVAAVHKLGKIHGELRPSNVRIQGLDEPRLLDFAFHGLVKRENNLRRSGEVSGHPAYLAPEQLQEPDRVTELADLYSLGALIYTLATGSAPFEGSLADMLRQVMQEKPPRVSSVRADGDRTFDFLCARLLEKKPERRYPSCQEVLQKLSELSEENNLT